MTTTPSNRPPSHTPYLCEYAHAPLDDCYCRKVTGRTVPNIVLYCMGRYRECPVYRRQLPKEDPQDA